MCLTTRRRTLGILPPADHPRRSADHRPSGDLCRPQRWAALAPQGPPTHEDQRTPVRGPHPALSHGRRRLDDHRGDRRRHGLGPPQRDRYGQAPVAQRATLLELAGAVSPAPDLGWDGPVAAGATRRASRHRRLAPGSPQCAPLPECLGSLLTVDAGAPWHSEGSHGNRAHAGAPRLSPAHTRQCLRPTGSRDLRSAVPRTQGHDDGEAGEGVGVSPGAPRGAGRRPLPRAAPVAPVLPERLPCPAMPHVARAQGQVCAQHPTTATPPRQQGLSNGGHPFHDAPHPFHDTPHPPPESPNLAGEFLGRLVTPFHGRATGRNWSPQHP